MWPSRREVGCSRRPFSRPVAGFCSAGHRAPAKKAADRSAFRWGIDRGGFNVADRKKDGFRPLMTSQKAPHDARFSGSKSPVPLYHRLYVILRDKLTNGTYVAGDLLPPEVDLVRTYGVSRVTAKRALDELAAEGLVERSRGRGTVATGKRFDMIGGTPLTANVDTLLANLETIGTKTNVQIISFGFVRAPKYVAEQLKISEEQEVQKAVRLRSKDGRPLAISTSFISPNINLKITPSDLKKNSLIRIVVESGHEISEVHQAISATLADDIAASLLHIPSGSPLIRIRRTFCARNAVPIDHVEMLYPSERFEYKMTLKR